MCEQRIPNALRRIDGLARRSDSDASVAGSTAWLQRRAEDARAAGRTDLVDRLERRAQARPGTLDRLADARTRLLAFQKEHCS